MNEIERGIYCFKIIAINDRSKADMILASIAAVVENPPDNLIEFLFSNGGIRPYHDEDTLDERPYNFQETIAYMEEFRQRLIATIEDQAP